MTLRKNYKQILRRAAIGFLSAVMLGLLLVTLAYSIPNETIQPNAEKSIAIVMEAYRNDPAREWQAMFDDDANTINYGCDRKWMRRAIVDDASLNALEAAMSVNGYTRYWHGYQIFVRPMLYLGTYESMVYVSVVLFFALLIICSIALYNRFGTAVTVGFFVSLALVRMLATALCLNNSGCFIAGMVMVLLVLRFVNTEKEDWLYPLFLLNGCFVNYVDVLTAPLVSLGLPLAIYLYSKLTDAHETSLRDNLTDTVALPAFWGVGYGLFWAMKWLIGSLVLGRNIVTDAVEQAGFRIAGDAAHLTSPKGAILVNLAVLTPDDGITRGLLIIGVIALLLLVILFHKRWSALVAGLPLLIVALSPFLWMCVLSNHSEIHAPFVFRILVVTVFALILFAIYAIDREKLQTFCGRLQRRRSAN